MPEPSILGKRMVAARKKAGLTQEKLSRMADVALNTIARLEQGHLQQLRSDNVVKLAAALGTDPNYLLGYKAKGKPQGERHVPLRH